MSVKTHLTTARSNFNNNCQRARNLTSIYGLLKNLGPAALDCDDILRSALVLAVSSFDLYLHDLLRLEAVYRLSIGKNVDQLKLPFNILIFKGQQQIDMVDAFIRREHSHKSFVAPDKLAECLKYLLASPWDRVSEAFGESGAFCKSRLKAVIDLRNRIAHEADVNPEYGGLELWPIYSEDVNDSIDFLGRLGLAIADVVEKY